MITIRDIAIAFGYDVDRNSQARAENSIKNLKAMATKLLGAIGIGFSLVKAGAIAGEFGEVNDRLRTATKEMGDQQEIQKKVLETANNIRGTYAETVDTLGNLVQQNSRLFDSTEKTLDYIELTNKAWKAAGRSEAEIASLNETLSSSFASGTVNASNFQTLIKKSPETIAYMEKALGKTRNELFALASAGKLSADTLYTAFSGSADEINAAFDDLDFNITDAVKNIRNRWGLFLDGLNSSLGISDTVGRLMVRSFNSVMNVLKKLQSWVERFSKAVGGTQNMFKLLAIAAGAIFLALNAGKIIAFLSNVSKLLSVMHLKILAIIAVIVIMALIVDDFISFMKGNDSVIGSLLEKAGIDSEKARETIITAWEAIKDFLGQVWDGIKNLAVMVFSALQQFWEAWGDKILNVLGILGRGIFNNIKFIFDIIVNLFKAFAALFSGDWNGFWEAIKNIAAAVWGMIVNTITMWLNVLWALFGDIFTNIKNTVGEKVTSIKETIVNGFQTAIDWIKSLPAQAIQWGKDIIQGIVDGIKGSIGDIADSVKGIGGTIKSFLGFSVPDEGPLSEFESWMPDFMQGLAQGIQKNKGLVTDAVKALTGDMSVSVQEVDAVKAFAGDMSMLVQGASPPKEGTAKTLAAGASNRSVTQNVNIENTFNGDKAIQKNTAKAMDSAADDATGQMARGLAYAR